VATETTTIKVVADTRDAERAIGGLTSALAALGGISFATNIASQFITIANTAAEITNKLIFATGSIDGANKAFDLLAATAQRTGSNLGGTVDLFQKLAQSATFAGSSNEALALVTERFNQTLQISGASGAGAASALYQFAQAMQKGTLNGDEMRTIMETNGYLMTVLEQQTGKTRVELIQMASQGQLSAEIIAKALINSDEIAKQYGKTIRTLPQAMENFNTSLTVAVKKLDDKLKITQALSKVLGFFADNIGAVIGGLAGLTVGIIALTVALIPAATAMAILTGGAALLAAAGVGAAIGLAVQQANKLTDEVGKTTKTQQQLNTEAKAGLKITPQRTTQEMDLDKALGEQITKLKETNKYLSQEGPIKDRNLEVSKAIATEQAKYLAMGKQIPAGLESQLRTQLMIKAVEEDRISTAKTLFGLAQNQVMALQTDAFERAALGKLQAYQNSVSKQEFDTKKGTVEQAIKQSLIAEYNNQLAQDSLHNQQRLNALSIQDVDLRNAALAIADAQKRFGKEFVDLNAQKIIQEAQSQRYAEYALELSKQSLGNQLKVNALAIADTTEREYQLSLIEQTVSKGEAWVKANESVLRTNFMQNKTAEVTRNLTDEILNKENLITAAMGLSTEQAKIKESIQAKINTLGSAFTVEMQKQYEIDLNRIAAMERQSQIQRALADLQASPTGADVAGAIGSQGASTETGVAKQRRAQEEALQALRDQSLISEQEYQNRLLMVQQNAATQRLTQQQAESAAILKNSGVTNQAVLDMVMKQQEQVAMIRQGGVVGAQGMLGATASIFQQLGTYNKKAFDTYKTLAIAQAMISTYQAAAMAIAMPPGPPLSFIYVAGAIAAGLAQVAAIRSQQFSGRALGGPVMGGQSYMVGENGPELFTPANSGQITRNDQLGGGGTTNVSFTIIANDTAGFDQLLSSRRGLITQIISDAQLERGRRA
jgi:tape measure domain-containing protein